MMTAELRRDETQILHYYRAFERAVDSDLALPFREEARPASPQLRIRRGETPPPDHPDLVYESVSSTGEVGFSLHANAASYLWAYPQAGSFQIWRDGSQVRWYAGAGAPADTASILAGPILAFAAQLQGQTCLHGSAFVLGDEAVGLIAPSGSGKSTLVVALQTLGYELLTDDVMAIVMDEGKAKVLPSQARVKLWPDSLGHFLGGTEWPELDNYVSWLDKRAVQPSMLGDSASTAKTLRAIFLLCPVPAGEAAQAVELHGYEALIAVMSQAYLAHLLTREPVVIEGQMDKCHRLAQTVPVYALAIPRSFDQLGEVANLVLSRAVRRDIAVG
jgi:hypothetical protein